MSPVAKGSATDLSTAGESNFSSGLSCLAAAASGISIRYAAVGVLSSKSEE